MRSDYYNISIALRETPSPVSPVEIGPSSFARGRAFDIAGVGCGQTGSDRGRVRVPHATVPRHWSPFSVKRGRAFSMPGKRGRWVACTAIKAFNWCQTGTGLGWISCRHSRDYPMTDGPTDIEGTPTWVLFPALPFGRTGWRLEVSSPQCRGIHRHKGWFDSTPATWCALS